MMRTRRPVLISACALGVAAITVTSVAAGLDVSAQTAGGGRAARLIDALHDCVLERFKEVDERLGTARITRRGAPHVFAPEQIREMTAVEELARARTRVVLYLAGREVLKPKPVPQPAPIHIPEQQYTNPMLWFSSRGVKREDAIEWGVIKGPIRVTPTGQASKGLPLPPTTAELWDETSRAMQLFSATESHDFDLGGWQFAARPVRVSDQGCLNCHTQHGATLMSAGPRPDNKLRVGDAVGVLLYGYKPMP
jgi:hypothetical protein